MKARQTEIKDLTKAFVLWEIDVRNNPDKYLSPAAIAAKRLIKTGERRAKHFIKLLDEVRAPKN